MKITVEIELSQHDQLMIRTTSLERVLNNAIKIGSYIEGLERAQESMKEDGSTLWQDGEELKPVASRLWNAAREAIFKEALKTK